MWGMPDDRATRDSQGRDTTTDAPYRQANVRGVTDQEMPFLEMLRSAVANGAARAGVWPWLDIDEPGRQPAMPRR
jgi:hypothetical protein